MVTETVFAWPGIGRLAIQSIYNRDYPVVQSTVFIAAVLFIAINLALDVLYGVLDPRARREGGAGRLGRRPAVALPAPRRPARARPVAALRCGLFVALLAVVAVAAPLLARTTRSAARCARGSRGRRSKAPDGKAYLLGTDQLGPGRAVAWSSGRGCRWRFGFAAVAVGGLVGGLLGLVAGFRGGWLDEIVMTVADAQLAFPFILLAIGIIAVLGPSFPNLIIVVGLSGWVTYARVLRSQVLSLRQRDFVSAILALGGSVPRVLVRHILPNVASTFMVIATLELARAIVLEATLSFLGLGIQPPTPSWGG